MRQTLEQERAKAAWEAINGREATANAAALAPIPGGTTGRNYTGWVRKASAMILNNGLGQTLAFLRAKGKNDPNSHYSLVYRHLSEWVLRQVRTGSGPETLLEWLLYQDSTIYRQATVEALAYLNWLKRFAEGRFGEVLETEA